MVSVIIPVYNVQEYLARCIDSVLCQSHKELEIILVDDGSTDHSGAMCDDYTSRDSRIKVIHKSNGGLSDARNAGLDVMTGDYVTFIDADDYLIPQQYEHCIDIIKQHHNIDLVQFDFTSGQATNKQPIDSTPVSGTEYLQNNNIFGTVWSMLFKKSIRGTLVFTPGIVCVEDEEFKPQLVITY